MATVGSVAELRRYPVKSLAGEVVDEAGVDERGLEGDRLWAVADHDGRLGSGKSTRRFRRMDGLLRLTASYERELTPSIGFPDGRRIDGADPSIHEALSDHVGRPVRLVSEVATSHFDEGPVHLVTTASITALEGHLGDPVSTARLRSNLLVDVGGPPDFAEEGWVGGTLRVGSEVVISIRGPMSRCVMVDLPQRDLPAADGLLDAIGRLNRSCVGVVADVVRPGRIRRHDPVELHH